MVSVFFKGTKLKREGQLKWLNRFSKISKVPCNKVHRIRGHHEQTISVSWFGIFGCGIHAVYYFPGLTPILGNLHKYEMFITRNIQV